MSAEEAVKVDRRKLQLVSDRLACMVALDKAKRTRKPHTFFPAMENALHKFKTVVEREAAYYRDQPPSETRDAKIAKAQEDAAKYERIYNEMVEKRRLHEAAVKKKAEEAKEAAVKRKADAVVEGCEPAKKKKQNTDAGSASGAIAEEREKALKERVRTEAASALSSVGMGDASKIEAVLL